MQDIIDQLKLDMASGAGWNDYDEYGIPYWDYQWHEDDEYGSNWRLVSK